MNSTPCNCSDACACHAKAIPQHSGGECCGQGCSERAAHTERKRASVAVTPALLLAGAATDTPPPPPCWHCRWCRPQRRAGRVQVCQLARRRRTAWTASHAVNRSLAAAACMLLVRRWVGGPAAGWRGHLLGLPCPKCMAPFASPCAGRKAPLLQRLFLAVCLPLPAALELRHLVRVAGVILVAVCYALVRV